MKTSKFLRVGVLEVFWLSENFTRLTKLLNLFKEAIVLFTVTYYCNEMVYSYGTDLTQRRTRTQVIGHHLPTARTPSSMSFNGLELELKRKPRVSS